MSDIIIPEAGGAEAGANPGGEHFEAAPWARLILPPGPERRLFGYCPVAGCGQLIERIHDIEPCTLIPDDGWTYHLLPCRHFVDHWAWTAVPAGVDGALLALAWIAYPGTMEEAIALVFG